MALCFDVRASGLHKTILTLTRYHIVAGTASTHRLYGTVSRDFIGSAFASLFIFVPLALAKPAENINFVTELTDKNIESHYCYPVA